jgi:hypothetical protein
MMPTRRIPERAPMAEHMSRQAVAAIIRYSAIAFAVYVAIGFGMWWLIF